MQLIDTHIHLYEDVYASDLDLVIKKALENGVRRMIIPNVDKHSIRTMNNITDLFPDSCSQMIGIHPCYVKEDYEIQLEDIHAELKTGKYIAIGEIGLDLYWDKTFYEEQKVCFQTQLTWASEKKLPVSIHSRDATKEAIELIKPIYTTNLTGVFHCFSGSEEEAREISEMGFYFGIGGVITFKNSGLDKILPFIPIDRVVLETDGPYLAPNPFRGKRNESSYLPYIVKRIAEIYKLTTEEVANITTLNAQRLFRISNQ